MSYDYPDGYQPGPPVRRTFRDRLAATWWSFVLWAALDSKWTWLNNWGMRRITGAR